MTKFKKVLSSAGAPTRPRIKGNAKINISKKEWLDLDIIASYCEIVIASQYSNSRICKVHIINMGNCIITDDLGFSFSASDVYFEDSEIDWSMENVFDNAISKSIVTYGVTSKGKVIMFESSELLSLSYFVPSKYHNTSCRMTKFLNPAIPDHNHSDNEKSILRQVLNCDGTMIDIRKHLPEVNMKMNVRVEYSGNITNNTTISLGNFKCVSSDNKDIPFDFDNASYYYAIDGDYIDIIYDSGHGLLFTDKHISPAYFDDIMNTGISLDDITCDYLADMARFVSMTVDSNEDIDITSVSITSITFYNNTTSVEVDNEILFDYNNTGCFYKE